MQTSLTMRGILLCLFFLLCSSMAYADDAGRLTLIEENDSFIPHNDKHYTQGLKLAYTSGPVMPNGGWDQPFNWLENFSIFEGANHKRKYEWTILGQSIFTPDDTSRTVPLTSDRPYAGWLYTGVSLLQETKHTNYTTLENAEILAGVVGPAALGEESQNDWHQFIGVNTARGWQHQLHNEPGVALTYEKKWKFEKPLNNYFSMDAIPEAGFTGGNVLTYAQTGMLLRFGHGLEADYGPNRIRPALSGTGWYDADAADGFIWYIFVGTQGRGVGHNIFLDGNMTGSSPSVAKNTFVADFIGGISMAWRNCARLDFTFTQRTPEFQTQPSGPDQFVSISFSLGF